MLDRLADWLDRQPVGRRRLYSMFIAVSLLTVPCYAAGALFLALAAPPAARPESTPAAPTAPAAIPTEVVATPVTFPTAIQRQPEDRQPAWPSPPPTVTVDPTLLTPAVWIVTLTPTPTIPAATSTVAPTLAATVPPVPTDVPVTLTPEASPAPTDPPTDEPTQVAPTAIEPTAEATAAPAP